MTRDIDQKLTTTQRRAAIRNSYENAALWAIGNGLASTTLISFLGKSLGAKGLAIGLLLAAPQLAGVLRLFAPAAMDRVGNRKRFCLGCYATSSILLVLLPLLSAPRETIDRHISLTALVVLWCLYHLAEYLGTIALWSWLADLVPRAIRGRFIGRRERWLLLGRIVGMVVSGLFSYAWINGCESLNFAAHPPGSHWIGYAIPATAGALLMAGSIIPLIRIPKLTRTINVTRDELRKRIAAPFQDARFLRLVAYGCCFSLFNGITTLAQFVYVAFVLKFPLLTMMMFQVGLRLGQSTVSPTVGRWADRFGNRPVMLVSQSLVAVALLFYFVATPETRWWIAGAWILWIAYVGLNVCLPNLMLKLAPDRTTSPHISTYYAVTGVFYGLSTIGGGVLLDYLSTLQKADPSVWKGVPLITDRFEFLFLLGFVLRSSTLLMLLRIVEPGAIRLRTVFRRKAEEM